MSAASQVASPDIHTPADCHVCGRHAIGVGIHQRDGNRWLCRECADIVEYVRSAKRLDAYELKARAGGVEAAAPLVQEYGPRLDEWEEEQVLMFCGAIWRGCADELRRLIKSGEAPF